ncbi:hypothetical protein [Lignipirellula cremea]|uniref:Uncharacterized protein n=1 Tax=Lignipirellula cremea TaxID=2528010 RepID=A0A518DQS1_9BACT|nr:hypothetical protein [Lignipirellula cremea]QDU94190.1 hypothetical protein Pla8534_19780 [Lignipirellula cremea]
MPARFSSAGRCAALRSLYVIAGFVLFLGLQAAAQAATPEEGDSSRASRDAATRLIPYDQLTRDAQAKLNGVISRTTVFRRLPARTIDCDPDMYVFLVRYPEVIVSIWQLMQISSAEIKRTAPYAFTVNDGGGTVSGVELIYGRSDLHIYYADGYYDGPMLRRRMPGKCVMILSTGYNRGPDGQPLVTHQMDVFLQLEQGGFEFMARTFFPLVAKNTDYNFIETSNFLAKVSEAAESNTSGVERMATQLNSCQPEVREKFAELATQTGHRAILRSSQPGDQNAMVNRAPAYRAPK